jgi:hypothetical protein
MLPPKKRGRYEEFDASSFGFDAQVFARKEANWVNSAPMDNLLALPNLKKKYHYVDFERGCTVFDDSYVQVSTRPAPSPFPRPSPRRKGSKISLERSREAERQRREHREQERRKQEAEREVCRRDMYLPEEYFHKKSAAESDTKSDCYLDTSISVREETGDEDIASCDSDCSRGYRSAHRRAASGQPARTAF